jgi:uncharacterized repeat protein (TIGR04138 family)
MRFCEICREPAVRSYVSLTGEQQPTLRHCCYVHAAEQGLLEAPWAALAAVAGTTGYAANAVIFVLEALTQDGCVAQMQKDPPIWIVTRPPRTAWKFCTAVRLWAIKQFQMQEHLVLNYWKLVQGEDIGILLSRLAASGVLALEEQQHSPLLRDLLALKHPLLDPRFRMV